MKPRISHVLAAAALLATTVCTATPPLRAQNGAASTREARSEKRPVMTLDARVTHLDDLGLYQLSYTRRGQPEKFFPTGWSGFFDDATGVANMPVGVQNEKRAWLLHPPWRGGVTGFTRQSFTFALPNSSRIMLRGAVALGQNNTAESDGVTFRVFANGEKLLDENRKATSWKNFSFDLTKFASQTVTLSFESDAGPQDNPSFDYALWGDRTLTIDGFNVPRHAFATPPALPLAPLVSTGTQKSVAPRGGYVGRDSVALSNGIAKLRYAGADGICEYSWRAPQAENDASLGALQLTARMKSADGKMQTPVNVPLARDAAATWIGGVSMTRISSDLQKTARGVALISRYEGGGKSATLRVEAQLVGKSLVLDATCDAPLLRTFSAGTFGPVMRRREITVPYYVFNGHVYFLEKENLFVNAFLDWTTSDASSHDGVRAIYDAKTDGVFNALRERAVFAPAWHMAETLPDIPHPKSPYLREVGSKLLLDNWTGNFRDTARDLETLHDYGIRDAIVLVHDWQRDGYDNGLPAHYPASEKYGGDAGMKVLASTATRLGYRIALHENYADYYPNYEHFDANDIALNADGSRVLAWFNPGTKIQSFGIKASAMLRLAKTQSPEIKRRYGTNANYLDVHSAVMPWWHVDHRAGEPDAAKFSQIIKAHTALWAYERKTFGGPVFGEGNAHWMWSGLLDGVEAQLDARQDTALLLDFDLLKIHPLQSNQGMGYYERWWNAPNWGELPPMRVLDRYRMQTLAFGHAGFLSRDTWNNLRVAWLENNLVTPVSARYATAAPREISYFLNGAWRDVDAAIRANLGNAAFDRTRIRYDNGLEIVVNNAATPFRVGEYSLQQFGWLARGAGVVAGTAMRGGTIFDFAETPTTTFVNARRAADWNLNDASHSSRKIVGFEQTAPRAFRLGYQ